MESLVTGLLYIDLDFHPNSPINMSAPPGSQYREIPTLPTTLQEVETQVRDVMDTLQRVKLDLLVNTTTETVQSIKRLVDSPEVMRAIRALNTALTSFDKLVREVNAHVDPLGKDLKEATKKAQDTLNDMQQLVQNVDSKLEPLAKSLNDTSKAVRAAMVQGKKTLASADGLIAEDSPLYHGLANALSELSRAARSVRVLADYLERNPNAIITGKR